MSLKITNMQLYPIEIKGKIYYLIKYNLSAECIIFVDYNLCFIYSDILMPGSWRRARHIGFMNVTYTRAKISIFLGNHLEKPEWVSSISSLSYHHRINAHAFLFTRTYINLDATTDEVASVLFVLRLFTKVSLIFYRIVHQDFCHPEFF